MTNPDPCTSRITITGTVQDKKSTVSKFIVSGNEYWHIESDVLVHDGDLVLVTGDFDWSYAADYDADAPRFHIRRPQITVLSKETS